MIKSSISCENIIKKFKKELKKDVFINIIKNGLKVWKIMKKISWEETII